MSSLLESKKIFVLSAFIDLPPLEMDLPTDLSTILKNYSNYFNNKTSNANNDENKNKSILSNFNNVYFTVIENGIESKIDDTTIIKENDVIFIYKLNDETGYAKYVVYNALTSTIGKILEDVDQNSAMYKYHEAIYNAGFRKTRSVIGDGNCYYAAVFASYVERIIFMNNVNKDRDSAFDAFIDKFKTKINEQTNNEEIKKYNENLTSIISFITYIKEICNNSNSVYAAHKFRIMINSDNERYVSIIMGLRQLCYDLCIEKRLQNSLADNETLKTLKNFGDDSNEEHINAVVLNNYFYLNDETYAIINQNSERFYIYDKDGIKTPNDYSIYEKTIFPFKVSGHYNLVYGSYYNFYENFISNIQLYYNNSSLSASPTINSAPENQDVLNFINHRTDIGNNFINSEQIPTKNDDKRLLLFEDTIDTVKKLNIDENQKIKKLKILLKIAIELQNANAYNNIMDYNGVTITEENWNNYINNNNSNKTFLKKQLSKKNNYDNDNDNDFKQMLLSINQQQQQPLPQPPTSNTNSESDNKQQPPTPISNINTNTNSSNNNNNKPPLPQTNTKLYARFKIDTQNNNNIVFINDLTKNITINKFVPAKISHSDIYKIQYKLNNDTKLVDINSIEFVNPEKKPNTPTTVIRPTSPKSP